MPGSNGHKAEAGDLRIDGKVYDPDDMTYREKREVRRILRDELGDGEPVDFEELPLDDLILATALVMARRDKPEFTLDDALELKHKDIYVDEDEPVPPTRRGSAAKKTSVATGPPKSQ